MENQGFLILALDLFLGQISKTLESSGQNLPTTSFHVLPQALTDVYGKERGKPVDLGVPGKKMHLSCEAAV